MNKKILISVLITSFLIIVCLFVIGKYCWNLKDFLDIKLLDLINIGLTVFVGAIFSIIIFCLTDNNEDYRRKKDIYHELLNRILNNFENDLITPSSKNLDAFWVNCLSIKTNSECILNSFALKNKNDEFKKSINELSSIISTYFKFVEENLVTSLVNKKISDDILRLETKYRDSVVNKTINASTTAT